MTLLWVFTHAYPLSNVLAVVVGVVAIAVTQLPSMRFAVALLACFFVYDIFWVFLSGHIFGESVMISVAHGLIPDDNTAYPALVTFRTFLLPGTSNVLGMGDILLPGIFLCYLYRVDVIKHRLARAAANAAAALSPAELEEGLTGADVPPLPPKSATDKALARLRAMNVNTEALELARGSYFVPAFVCYLLGLAITFVMVVLTQSGQPALLYLTPAVLAYPLIQGYRKGELKSLWVGAFDIPEGVDPDAFGASGNKKSKSSGPDGEVDSEGDDDDGVPAIGAVDAAAGHKDESRGDIVGIEEEHDDEEPKTTTTTTTTSGKAADEVVGEEGGEKHAAEAEGSAVLVASSPSPPAEK